MCASIKRILLLQTNGICHGILNACNERVSISLNKMGVSCDLFYCTGTKTEMLKRLSSMLSSKYDAVLAFNSIGYNSLIDHDGGHLFDQYNTPFYNYIVDSPMSYKAYTEPKCKEYHVFCVDENHVQYIKHYFPKVKSARFLPIGGMETEESQIKPFADRLYDVTYYAGVERYTLREFIDYINKKTHPINTIMLNMIEYMTDNKSCDDLQALKMVLKDRFGVTDLEESVMAELLQQTYETQLFMRSYSRELVVKTLVRSKVRFHLFGDDWINRIGKHEESTVFHPGFPYNRVSGVLNESRIVLNVFPWFKNGSNERIAGAMLNKAVVLTDKSKYFDKIPEGIVCAYDLDDINKLPAQIGSILERESETEAITERAYSFAKKNMTWDNVVYNMVKIMEDN